MSKIRPLVSPKPKPGVSITRRQLCQSLVAGAALVGPGLLPLNASASADLDLSSDRDLLRALVKGIIY